MLLGKDSNEKVEDRLMKQGETYKRKLEEKDKAIYGNTLTVDSSDRVNCSKLSSQYLKAKHSTERRVEASMVAAVKSSSDLSNVMGRGGDESGTDDHLGSLKILEPALSLETIGGPVKTTPSSAETGQVACELADKTVQEDEQV